jgi:hypothetical protein
MRDIRCIALALAVVSMPTAALGQNLVANPQFDSDVSDWATNATASIEWSPADADGSPSSGSALVTNLSTTANDSTGAYQCVDGIMGEAPYRVAAEVMVPGGQVETGFAHLLVQWYSGPGCSGFLDLAVTPGVPTTTPDAWYAIHTFAVAPVGAQSARLRLSIWKNEDSGMLQSHFDNVELERWIFVDGFESGDTSVWSGTVP